MPWHLDFLWASVRADIDAYYDRSHDLTGKSVSPFEDPPDEDFPIVIRMQNGPRRLPDFARFVSAVYVNEAARRILERFEPERLRFRDAVVLGADGRPVRDAVWKLTVSRDCLVEDGIVLDQSDVTVHRRRMKLPDGRVVDLPPVLGIKREPPQLMWSRGAIGDRHLWADTMLKDRIIVSDELYAAIKAGKLTGFQAQECRFAVTH